MTQASRDLERWLPIARFEGFYEVSDLGRVRSVDRTVESTSAWGRPCMRTYRGQLLTPVPIWDGHLRVKLGRPGRKNRLVRVHHLVLKAFVGPCPTGLLGCHDDDDPTNNSLNNLRWDTPSSNIFDQVRSGKHRETQKRKCPRRHLLVMPNLMPSQLKRGARSCLACSRARQTKVVRSDPSCFQAVSDQYYAEIMGSLVDC